MPGGAPMGLICQKINTEGVSKAFIPFSFDQLLEAYANAIKNGFGPEAIYFAALDRWVSDQNQGSPGSLPSSAKRTFF
jgi:hypothetical protein